MDKETTAEALRILDLVASYKCQDFGLYEGIDPSEAFISAIKALVLRGAILPPLQLGPEHIVIRPASTLWAIDRLRGQLSQILRA